MKKNIYKAGISAFVAGVLITSCASSKSSVFKLIKEGKNEDAKALFKAQDANEVDEDGNTSLHLAAMLDEADLVNFLILKGANIEAKNKDGDTPLHLAIKNNAIHSGESLVTFGANVFEKDSSGNTSLDLIIPKDEIWYKIMINKQTGSLKDENGQSIVHYFVRAKNEKIIDYCINEKINLDVADNNGITPLMIAYEAPESYESMKIAAKLIQNEVKLTGENFDYFEKAVSTHNLVYRFEDGQTPLHIATILNHEGIVDYVLNEKTTITPEKILQSQDSLGSTPLHEAVRYGRTSIAEKMLKKGANIESLDAMGNSPVLVLIPQEAQKDIYSLLISYNANLNQKDTFGDTVLHKATLSNSDTEILDILLKANAQINERNKQGITPLALAIDNENTSHIEFYAKNGADIYAADNNGLTPIGRAMKTSSIDVLKTLISKSNVNTKDSLGNTPLHLAVEHNAPNSFISYLLEVGADVKARNSNGDSALFIATRNNNKDAGELLLANNADIFSTNMTNNSPLRIALSNKDVQSWFITPKTLSMKDGTLNTPLHYAAEWGLEDAVKMLICKGSDINAVNANAQSPIFSATKGDSSSIIKILVDNGAVIDSRNVLSRDNLGNTPVHFAVRWDSKKAAKTLLSYGVDVDAQNLDGKTALNNACRMGKVDMTMLLINNGANINAVDNLGKTVLMDAVQSQNSELIDLLLKNGANASIKNMNGRSAYHDAAKSENIKVIETIRKAGGNPLERDANGETPLSIVLNSDNSVIKAVLGKNSSIVNTDGNTPIHIAVEENASVSTLSMLLNMGYPVSQRNGQGMTALNIAVTNDTKDLALALLEKNADPYLATNDGQNPITTVFKTKNTYILDAIVKYNKTKTDKQGDNILHYAARYADLETTKHLVELGLNKNLKNISGETPAQMAARWNRNEIAEILK